MKGGYFGWGTYNDALCATPSSYQLYSGMGTCIWGGLASYYYTMEGATYFTANNSFCDGAYNFTYNPPMNFCGANTKFFNSNNAM